MKNVNKTGYLDKSTTKYNKYNIIPSSNITMDGVSQKLMVVELDKNGKIIGTKFLEPNSGEYNFPNAQNIMETPQYKKGGDKKYTQEDLDMYLAMYMNGGMDEYQIGGQRNIAPPYDFIPPVDNSLEGYQYNTLQIPQNQVQQPTQQRQVQKVASTFPTAEVKELEGAKIETTDALENDFNPEERQGVELTGNPDIQFFNQYQGVDIPTAATTLGTSIEAGDTLGTVASSLKLATGLGRNIFGGIGQQRQYNRQQKDFYEKIGEHGAPKSFKYGGSGDEDLINYMLMGGTEPTTGGEKKLTKEQVKDINNTTGVEFTEKGANQLFETIEKTEKPNYPTLNLGKFKDVGYYDVAMNSDEYRISPSNKNYKNSSSYRDDLMYLKKLNPDANIGGIDDLRYYKKLAERRPENYSEQIAINSFAKGGQYNSGEYRTGIDEEMLTDEQKQLLNAETEAGEYIKEPNTGQVSEIIGDKHSQGGEKMIMEDGEKVLTDHTKLGAKNAKYIRDTYDLNVKAKNTYADALDKLRSKSGLKKLITEEEGYIKQLEEQKDGDETTQGINSKFLQGKLEEIKAKKEPIEMARQAIFDDLYRIQEADKPKSETDDFQTGGRYTGEGSAIDNVPAGQSQNDKFYGQVDEAKFIETVKNNPWFDFTNFDPSNPQDVARFQSEYNRLSTKGTQVTVDGKFGEQTQTIKLPQEVLNTIDAPAKGVGFKDELPTGTVPNLATSQQPDIQQLIDSGASEEEIKKAMNVALLPNQYPMMPGSLEPTIKQRRSYERFDPSLIDPSLYLEQLQRQQAQVERQTEGLPPSVRAAALANVQANTQKAASDIMLRIDSQNMQSKNQAELYNTRVGNREEDARVKDNLNYEQRMLQGKGIYDNDLSNYFNAITDTNVSNYKDINALNRANIVSDHQFDGQSYISPEAPDFSKYYEMTQNLAKYQKEQEELEKKSKK